MIIGGTKGYVITIDERTGEEIWRTKLETGGIINVAGYGSVMVVLKGNIIIASCNGHMWGLDLNGGVLWHNGLSGLGNMAICMATEGVSVQYVHSKPKSSE